MHNLSSDAYKNIIHPRYPELYVFFGLVGYLLFIGLPAPYPLILTLLVIVGLIVSAIAIFQPKRFVILASILIMLVILIAALQFNFVPSIALWLLIFTRFMLAERKYNSVLLMTTIVTAVFSVLAFKFFVPAFTLTKNQQGMLDFLSLFLTTIVVSVLFRRLILRVQSLKEEHSKTDRRIKTFVTITNKLTRFLPPQVWQPIIKHNSAVDVISNRRKLTILFSDIVGFTDLSDNISPDHLANILNTYFDRMTQITQKYGATLDKFIGDGLLCYFGDTPNSNDRECAIRCAAMAIEMRREMEVLRQHWRLLGFEGLYIRIGINTGYCYVGNFGSRNRMTYTVIGREANLASRLESSAQKNQILISEATYNLISHEHNCRLVGNYEFKGFQTALPVWEVLDPNMGQQPTSKWVDYNLPGFNLHLNFQDIRNYDKRTILNYLNNALDLMEKNKDNPQ